MSKLQDQLFNLKFTSKQLQNQSKKCEANEKKEKAKLKQAIEKGNMEGAKIYAQNAIREKNQALNLLRLSSRIDGVASKLEMSIQMRTVTRNMGGIVKNLDKAMKQMNLEQMTKVMDQFEKQFEDLDVQTDVMENAMGSTTALSTPASEVNDLISQVAEENGLAVGDSLGAAPVGIATGNAVSEPSLEDRLAKLKGI